jgi:hypothetical protein
VEAGGSPRECGQTSVGVSCSPSSILVDGTSKCSATVVGTGNFNSSVTWSVDKGTIDQNGNYTAPEGSTTATVLAASDQDPTKSGTAAITVNPTTFNWSVGPSPSSFSITGQCFAGDYNGDKKTDIACYSGSGENAEQACCAGRTVVSSCSSLPSSLYPILLEVAIMKFLQMFEKFAL